MPDNRRMDKRAVLDRLMVLILFATSVVLVCFAAVVLVDGRDQVQAWFLGVEAFVGFAVAVPCTSYVRRWHAGRGGSTPSGHTAWSPTPTVSVQPYGWTKAVTAVTYALLLGCIGFMLATTAWTR